MSWLYFQLNFQFTWKIKVSFHRRHEIVWMTPNFWTVVYILRYLRDESRWMSKLKHITTNSEREKEALGGGGTQQRLWDINNNRGLSRSGGLNLIITSSTKASEAKITHRDLTPNRQPDNKRMSNKMKSWGKRIYFWVVDLKAPTASDCLASIWWFQRKVGVTAGDFSPAHGPTEALGERRVLIGV